MRKLFAVALFLTSATIFAQGTLTGTVMDSGMDAPLPGANVVISGTNNGTTTNFDGEFTLEVTKASGTLVISYIGFKAVKVNYVIADGETKSLGKIMLVPDADALAEIVVVGSGVIDLESDRKTPIAVSTIGRTEIQQKAAGNVEFPEVMKNTPSVYVSNQSGGFGDSQMFLRGFDQTNTAFLLNGQPINGMEDGKMYWSNWSGITDIANAVQVQRGLGSSKLAISSVGGTVNIVSKATDRTEGGFARLMVGNDSYLKGTFSYDTGINDNGWGFSFLLDHWQGYRKYAAGTRGAGENYFFSVGKRAGKHNFNLLLVGAPQWHDQNFSKNKDLYDQFGLKYNNNYGYKNGEYLSLRRNYYHKPVLNLNWDWDISEDSNLSTVLYASMGRGGGTGDLGNGVAYIDNDGNPDTRGAYNWDTDGLIDWNYIVNDYNPSIPGGLSQGRDGTLLRASVNNHLWYGAVTNFSYDAFKNWSLNVGADLRFYEGDHFQQLTDLLGLKGRVATNPGRPDGYVVSATFSPDPWSSLFNYADKGERVNYDYSESINYQGAFGQAEYAKNQFSVFVQASASNQSYQREDRWNLPTSQESKTVDRTGYNLKAGTSYAITDEHKLFVNAGKYSRQPFLDNIFSGGKNEIDIVDPEVENEEILGLEAGYRYENAFFNLNLNAYYTKWENRFLSTNGTYDMDNDGVVDYADAGFLFTNITQIHKGLELDIKTRPIDGWMLRGFATIGDWKYDGKTPIRVRDNSNYEFVDELTANLTGTKVGMAPQFSLGLGTKVDLTQNFSIDADYNYYGDLYGFVDVEEVGQAALTGDSYQSEKLDNYGLVDLGATYNFRFAARNIQLRGNIYNLFDTTYIGQKDQYGYYYGNGLTWNFSVKYQF